MKRSVQEIVELLVFGLIALLIGTGLLWLAGWVFDLVGVLFKFFAGLIWSLLRFIVPVAVGAAIVYALVRLIQQQREKRAARQSAAAVSGSPTEPAPPASSSAAEPPPPPASPDGNDSGVEGESHPTASEVWVPPQPSPPTSSAETLEEPRPAEDSGPVTEPSVSEEAGVDPLDPAPPADETTTSVPPAASDDARGEPFDDDTTAEPVEDDTRAEPFDRPAPADGEDVDSDDDKRDH